MYKETCLNDMDVVALCVDIKVEVGRKGHPQRVMSRTLLPTAKRPHVAAKRPPVSRDGQVVKERAIRKPGGDRHVEKEREVREKERTMDRVTVAVGMALGGDCVKKRERTYGTLRCWYAVVRMVMM